MILFLHGAGERGDDLDRVQVHGIPKIVKKRPDFPFIAVAPQCPKGEFWDVVKLIELLDRVAAKHAVDPTRVYVTGLSMGGYGTWALLASHPERIAAAAPICGGGKPETAARFAHVPVWAFHGEMDPVVPVARTTEMVDALRAAGSERVKQTLYPKARHDSWTKTYANGELYDWFLLHRLKKPAKETGDHSSS